MRARLTFIALGCTLFASLTALSQAPSKPSNATGQCKDGTYWTGASKSGACRGHQGIQTWYGTPSANQSPSGTPAASKAPVQKPSSAPTPAPAPAPAPMAKSSPTPPKPSPTAQPGGGPGLVWVNTSTKVYHCYGDRYYGKTKEGKYMSEADAKAMGAKGDAGRSCSK
jgi:hypothetical protein